MIVNRWRGGEVAALYLVSGSLVRPVVRCKPECRPPHTAVVLHKVVAGRPLHTSGR